MFRHPRMAKTGMFRSMPRLVQRFNGSIKNVSVTDLFRSARKDQSSWGGAGRGCSVRAIGSKMPLRKRASGFHLARPRAYLCVEAGDAGSRHPYDRRTHGSQDDPNDNAICSSRARAQVGCGRAIGQLYFVKFADPLLDQKRTRTDTTTDTGEIEGL